MKLTRRPAVRSRCASLGLPADTAQPQPAEACRAPRRSAAGVAIPDPLRWSAVGGLPASQPSTTSPHACIRVRALSARITRSACGQPPHAPAAAPPGSTWATASGSPDAPSLALGSRPAPGDKRTAVRRPGRAPRHTGRPVGVPQLVPGDTRDPPPPGTSPVWASWKRLSLKKEKRRWYSDDTKVQHRY